MTAGLTSLPIRSSPTRRSILLTARHIAHVHTSSSVVQVGSAAEPMFAQAAQAHKDREARAAESKAALAKQLFPSSSPSANADIRDRFGKTPSSKHVDAKDTIEASVESQRNLGTTKRETPPGRLGSICGQSDSFKEGPMNVVDLTTGGAAPAKHKEIIFLDDEDFSDFEEQDLDFEIPTALPPAPKPKVKHHPAKENVPPSSTQDIPWSSSPPSHFLPPQKLRQESTATDSGTSTVGRDTFTENDSFDAAPAVKAKKRKLPPSFNDAPPPAPAQQYKAVQTPARASKSFLDPTASTIKEQKRQLKSQRQHYGGGDDDDYASIQAAMYQAQEAVAPKVNAISLSSEQQHVLDLVVNKGQSVFFTGAAGTGKSVLMRSIISELKKKHTRNPERVAVTASTGLAACNISGVTLHSFSGIGLGKEDVPELLKKVRRNPNAKKRWLQAKCLIIDEISMVDGELFDKLSQIGRTIRSNGRPWGGIQLIITGDFFQLPPVPEGGRAIKFAFEAATWNTSIDHTIGLTEVFRQRDPVFAGMLNEMRLGEIRAETVNAFRALSRPLKFDDGIDMAELYPMRHQVENSNLSRLKALPGQPQKYEAMDSGDPKIRDKLLTNMMAPKVLELKVDAQVMLIKNLDEHLVNGSLGKVIGFSDERTYTITGGGADLDGEVESTISKAKRKLAAYSRDADSPSSTELYPIVRFTGMDGQTRDILCQPEEWKVELPNGEVQAQRSQLPLILAWALSIHKAQGQTLERVTVDLGKIFEKGQAYVALSRATTQDGLQVRNFDKTKVMAHPRVCTFYKQLYSAEEALKRRRPAAPSNSARGEKAGAAFSNPGDATKKLASYGFS